MERVFNAHAVLGKQQRKSTIDYFMRIAPYIDHHNEDYVTQMQMVPLYREFRATADKHVLE